MRIGGTKNSKRTRENKRKEKKKREGKRERFHLFLIITIAKSSFSTEITLHTEERRKERKKKETG
jgi:hypothetical protein